MKRRMAGLAALVLTGGTLVAASQARPTDDTALVTAEWIRAVQAHSPGQQDEPLRVVREFSPAQREDLAIGRALVLALKGPGGVVVRTTAEKTIASLAGGITDINAFLYRAAVLHGDIAILDGPGHVGAADADEARAGLFAAIDGGYLGPVAPNRDWALARALLDRIVPSPRDDPFVSDWYHASVAYLLGARYSGEASLLLEHQRRIMPRDARMLVSLGVLWEHRGLPRSQQILSTEDLIAARLRRAGNNPLRLPGTQPGIAAAIPPPEVANATAERYFREAIEADPDAVEARVRLARLLAVRGRHDEARAMSERAIETGLSGALGYYAHLIAARALAGSDPERAARHVEAALALFPNAQSARLAASHLALQRADDRAAVAAVAPLTAAAAADRVGEDPWWYYHIGSGRDAAALLRALWSGLR